ncbi:MAG: sigma-54-dependent Fis family transcriptional regulator [Bacteroidales bacterium]|nr:sigma-54-dependent Fis family transcriptional regulator [Bacteroidales bacterium]
MELQNLKSKYGLIGDDPKFNKALEVAERVAKTDLSVLVSGESGVGKESIPQIIHSSSARKHNKYIAVNCGAIPEGTMESELFGHIKGSFTGANETRKGYFEVADGGTIFLDEVGELSSESQKRLLRVLESGEFYKVGSSNVQKTNVRVIAATNVNLLDAIKQKRFREDLYYRLNQIPIELPPLRERRGDINMLFRKFAVDCADNYGMPPISLTRDALHLLQSYNWPGNIRQLRNIVEQISVLESNRTIDLEVLKSYLPPQEYSTLPALTGAPLSSDTTFAVEKEMIYKLIYSLKQEIDALKKSLAAISSQPQTAQYQPQNIQVTPTSQEGNVIVVNPEHEVEELHEEEDKALSIRDMYKERIIAALEKYPRNKKAVAQELGISERTLYRKILDYGIEIKRNKRSE